MDMRDRILHEARRLTIAQGAIPSLNHVAAAAGASKGGLIHHFPTRDALVEGLGRQALAEVDAVMTDAASRGKAARTWLGLSALTTQEREVYLALVTAYQAMHAGLAALVDEAAVMTDRCEGLIAAELGDPVRARIVRLVGDGLTANAMISPDLALDDPVIDEILAAITGSDSQR